MDSELSGRSLRGEPLRCPVDGSRLVQVEYRPRRKRRGLLEDLLDFD